MVEIIFPGILYVINSYVLCLFWQCTLMAISYAKKIQSIKFHAKYHLNTAILFPIKLVIIKGGIFSVNLIPFSIFFLVLQVSFV